MPDLEDRLRSLLEERAERYSQGRTIPPGLVRRARRAAVASVVATCVVASGVAAGGYFAAAALRPEASGGQGPVGPGQTSPGPTSSHRSTAPPRSTFASRGWTFQLVLALPGALGDLVAGPDALYSAYLEDGASASGRIARLDLSTGSIVRSRPFSSSAGLGVIDMALAGRSLWITAASTGAPVGRRSVYQLDPQTLAVRREVVVSRSAPQGFPGVILSAPAGLWVSVGSELVLLDPSDGSILRRVTVPSISAPLAVDPTGRLLYVATRSPGDTSVSELSERDAATGALAVRMRTPGFSLGVNGGAATADGLWISVPTGMMGYVGLLRRSDLSSVEDSRSSDDSYTNGIRVVIAAGRLWLEDEMISRLGCADPSTGVVFGQVQIPGALARGGGLTDVVLTRNELYAGTAAGIVRITPNASCGL